MSILTVSTSKYIKIKTKTVLIDDIQYEVRELGAGDQLAMMDLARKITKLKAKFDNLKNDNEKIDLVEQMADIAVKMEEIYAGLFDDGSGNQENSKRLVRTLGVDKVQLLLADIFKKVE